MILVFFVGILVAAAIALLLFGMGQALQPVDEMDQRLEEWIRAGGEDPLDEQVATPFLGRVEKSISRRNFGENTKADLARADLSLTVTEYLLIRAGITLAGVIIGYLLQEDLIAGLLLGLVGFFLPTVYVRSRQSQRLRAFHRQLPDVLDHLVGSLRAGYGLLQAVEWVGKQLPDPAGMEFDRVIREVQLGRGLNDALDSMVRRIDSDDLALIVTAIKIQHEIGGSLADILATVGHTIRERVRIQREIGVLTAQQRYSGYVLMIMPIAMGIVLYLINPEYERQLFKPGPTLCIPVGAGIMLIVGFFIMRRIIDIEV